MDFIFTMTVYSNPKIRCQQSHNFCQVVAFPICHQVYFLSLALMHKWNSKALLCIFARRTSELLILGLLASNILSYNIFNFMNDAQSKGQHSKLNFYCHYLLNLFKPFKLNCVYLQSFFLLFQPRLPHLMSDQRQRFVSWYDVVHNCDVCGRTDHSK